MITHAFLATATNLISTQISRRCCHSVAFFLLDFPLSLEPIIDLVPAHSASFQIELISTSGDPAWDRRFKARWCYSIHFLSITLLAFHFHPPLDEDYRPSTLRAYSPIDHQKEGRRLSLLLTYRITCLSAVCRGAHTPR
jgi:hypothetical protein